jgi:hypothetical protein
MRTATMTKSEFAPIMAFLFAGLGREPNAQQVAVWYECLQDLPAEAIKRAMKRCLQRNDSGFPSIASIRGLAGDSGDQDRALLAWQTLRCGLRRFGAYASVDFEDRTINAVIRNLGSWTEISKIEGDEFYVWFRKRFIDTYQSLSRSGVSEEMVAPLPGIVETENRASGFSQRHITAPIVVKSVGSDDMLISDHVGIPARIVAEN